MKKSDPLFYCFLLSLASLVLVLIGERQMYVFAQKRNILVETVAGGSLYVSLNWLLVLLMGLLTAFLGMLWWRSRSREKEDAAGENRYSSGHGGRMYR